MKPLALLVLMLLSGCAPQKATSPLPRPQPASVIEGEKAKDATVTQSANAIDKIVEADAPQVAAPVKVETDAIRKAVVDAPALKVELLAKEFQRALDALEKHNAELRKQLADMQDAEQRKQVAWLRWVGFGAVGLAALLAYLRNPLGMAVGGIGLLALGLAQLIAQPWFSLALQIGAVIGLVGLGWAVVHAYRKGTLADKLERERLRMSSTLPKVVATLDKAYEEADEARRKLLDDTIFSALSRKMDADEKKLIHEVRAK